MSATNAPFGLRPVYHPSGTIRQEMGTILNGYTSNIFKGSPVKINTDGNINAAAIGDRFVGSFVGCEYTGSNGRRVVGNTWPASTVATDAICYYTADPDIIYRVQANGTVPQSAIGESADFAVAVTGNATTGISIGTISSSTSSSTIAQLIVHGLWYDQANAWGDAFTVVLARIGKHQYTASPATF